MSKLLSGGAVACAAVVLCTAFSNSLKKREYTVRTKKISGEIKIAQISDLHDCIFGEKQSKLVEMLDLTRPDIIVMTGDIVEDTIRLNGELPDEPNVLLYAGHPARQLIEAAVRIAPVYMVLGNHEANIIYRERLVSELTKLGVTLVGGRKVNVRTAMGDLLICGADDPRFGDIQASDYTSCEDIINGKSHATCTDIAGGHGFSDNPPEKRSIKAIEKFCHDVARHIEDDCCKDTSAVNSWREKLIHEYASVARSDSYTLLLSHRPEEYQLYRSLGFDAAFSGHAHGGQWRLPPLINGVYAPHQGIFPSHAGGFYRYDDDRFVHVVSRADLQSTGGMYSATVAFQFNYINILS